MPVNTRHPDYAKMIERWQRCRDVSSGQDAVHGAGERYLPKLKEQEDPEYKAYVGRATFYNATWRTIAGLKGMLFEKAPKIEVPGAAKEMMKDVTMSGVPVEQFLQETCEEALKMGRLGLLVDYPTAQVDRMTLADAKAANLRPTIQLYHAESIINWRTGPVNNVVVLTLVVLEESALAQEDEFKSKETKRWRVLDLVNGAYRVRVYEIDAGGKEVQVGGDVYPLMNGKPLDYVPFTFIGFDDSTPTVDEPPLIDLVNLNISHYRSTADYEHGAHFTGLPTPWVSGVVLDKPGDKLYIGSQAAWVLKNENAKVGYLEFTGQGLEALRNLIKDKELQMAVLGARMLEPQKKGVQTAEAESVHRKGEESMLSEAADSISLGFEKALRWFCDWAGAAGEPEVELNKDYYPQAMTAPMLSALVGAWQMGAISDQTLFDNLQRGEVIAQGVTLEEEQAALLSSGPPKPTGGEPPLPANDAQGGDQGGQGKKGTTSITTPKGEVYKVQHS